MSNFTPESPPGLDIADQLIAPEVPAAATKLSEGAMDSSKGQIRIELTPEQKAKIRNVTGKDADAVELSVEELEERIAPVSKIPTPGK
jgi:hypothetical protein